MLPTKVTSPCVKQSGEKETETMLITNTFDLIILIIGIVGTGLCVLQAWMYDWDLKAMMFKEEDE